MKLRIALALLTLFLVTGCATSRSVVTIGNQPSYNNANPDQGAAIKLTVTDNREFQLKPPTPDIPSLKDGAITDKATTTRAIGRKRNGYGKALGDILLPADQTVAEVATDAIANGFRQAGYRVLKAGDPGFETATNIEANIKQYWAWVDIGFWALTLHCRSEVHFSGELDGFKSGITILSETQKQTGAAFESDWQDISNQGLLDLTREISRKLPRQNKPN